MTTIELPEQCKNSPRALLVCELLTARTTQNLDLLQQWCTPETLWELVGDRTFTGVEEILPATAAVFDHSVTVLTIDTVLSHGKFVAATGTLYFDTHDCWRFSEVLEFSGHSKAAKLNTMSSYWIECGAPTLDP